MENNGLKWRDNPEYQQARNKMQSLVAELAGLQSTEATAKTARTAADNALRDMEAKQLLGQATAEDVEAARVELEDCDRMLQRATRAIENNKRAQEILKADMPKVEYNAASTLREEIDNRYRQALAKLVTAVAPIVEKNSELISIEAEALNVFQHSTTIGDRYIARQGGIPALDLGDLAKWLESAREYLRTENRAAA